MLSIIAMLAYGFFVLSTIALMWAVKELRKAVGKSCDWEPGTNPYSWRV